LTHCFELSVFAVIEASVTFKVDEQTRNVQCKCLKNLITFTVMYYIEYLSKSVFFNHNILPNQFVCSVHIVVLYIHKNEAANISDLNMLLNTAKT